LKLGVPLPDSQNLRRQHVPAIPQATEKPSCYLPGIGSTVNWLARSFFADETVFNNIHVSYAINGIPAEE
jgi:hypothetical protein